MEVGSQVTVFAQLDPIAVELHLMQPPVALGWMVTEYRMRGDDTALIL